MFKVQPRGVLSRSRKCLYLALAVVGIYWLLLTTRVAYRMTPLGQEGDLQETLPEGDKKEDPPLSPDAIIRKQYEEEYNLDSFIRTLR